MINFFRNIRRQLANENKFQKYFRYAFGEILLVVIGIIIALQLNNWNDNRKQEIQFNEIINKIYSATNTNIEALHSSGEKLLRDLQLIDYLLNFNRLDTLTVYSYNQVFQYYDIGVSKNLTRFNIKKAPLDTIEPYKIPHLLYMLENNVLDVNFENPNAFNSLLNPNPDNKDQNDITQKIIRFNSNLIDFKNTFNSSKSLSIFFSEHNIPNPRTVAQTELYYNWEALNDYKYMYLEQEISKVLNLLKEDELRTQLRNIVAIKFAEFRLLINLYEDGRNLLSTMKNYQPDIQLNYKGIGILGDAVEGWNQESTPMLLTNPKLGIWELDIHLKEGFLKFRNDNSWILNWGGIEFPKGYTTFYGGNIPIEEGDYHIILNLTENTYEFIKQDDQP